MGREVSRGVPFYAADVWRGRDRWVRGGKVAGGVCRFHDMLPVLIAALNALALTAAAAPWFRLRDHVQVVQKDPEDFLSHIRDLSAPESVWPRRAHVQHEVDWLLVLGLLGLTEIGQDAAGSLLEEFGWGAAGGGQEVD